MLVIFYFSLDISIFCILEYEQFEIWYADCTVQGG
jgi:hypothetical protein